ncbi:MAG: RloB domain-containing protein [Clostridia bacterium]|nr:RloB domain-containing protein [Clostridia bacterium]
MERPKKEIRKQELLYIIGCEGINQEKMYFEKIQMMINAIESRKYNILFDYAEPFGGNPKCIVERTIKKSIGKTNKASVFDYDGQKVKYEEAIELATDNKIELGYSNYCFDLWLILHKKDYFSPVSNQASYAADVRKIYGLDKGTDIKKADNVKKIMSQIELSDVVEAIKRGKAIAKNNSAKVPNLTAAKSYPYYNNPDTQMHVLLEKILVKAGIKI